MTRPGRGRLLMVPLSFRNQIPHIKYHMWVRNQMPYIKTIIWIGNLTYLLYIRLIYSPKMVITNKTFF